MNRSVVYVFALMFFASIAMANDDGGWGLDEDVSRNQVSRMINTDKAGNVSIQLSCSAPKSSGHDAYPYRKDIFQLVLHTAIPEIHDGAATLEYELSGKKLDISSSVNVVNVSLGKAYGVAFNWIDLDDYFLYEMLRRADSLKMNLTLYDSPDKNRKVVAVFNDLEWDVKGFESVLDRHLSTCLNVEMMRDIREYNSKSK